MLPTDVVEMLMNALQKITNRTVKMVRGEEIESVCPLCGGSKSKVHKRQFYVNIKQPPYWFHCFRCGAKGTFTELIKHLYKAYGNIINLSMSSVNQTTEKKKVHINGNTTMSDEQVVLTPWFSFLLKPKDELCPFCKQYVMERLLSLTSISIGEHLFPYPVVSKLLEKFHCCKSMKTLLNELNVLYVGVETFFKTKIQGRAILVLNNEVTEVPRYKSVTIYPFGKTFPDYPLWVLPRDLTRTSSNKGNLVIVAEGVYSLLRGFLLLLSHVDGVRFLSQYNVVYLLCSFGKDQYRRALEWFYSLVVPFFSFYGNGSRKSFKHDLLVLSDSDVSLSFLEEKLKWFDYDKCIVLYPPNEYKDFGEPWSPENISLVLFNRYTISKAKTTRRK